jgi:hypothetical protein
VIEDVMNGHTTEAVTDLDVVLKTDAAARVQASAAIERLALSAKAEVGG